MTAPTRHKSKRAAAKAFLARYPKPKPNWSAIFDISNDRTYLVVCVLVFLGGMAFLTWNAAGSFNPLLPLWGLIMFTVWKRGKES